jgi:hypothetical protein
VEVNMERKRNVEWKRKNWSSRVEWNAEKNLEKYARFVSYYLFNGICPLTWSSLPTLRTSYI